MEKLPMVFVHGWALAPNFWNDLSSRFPQYDKTSFNLGYQGAKHTQAPAEKSVYITHSLGTMWALKNHAEYMKALIVINGFYRFNSFTDHRVLKAMKLRLKKNPKDQVQSFFENAGIQQMVEGLNVGNLDQGLDMLQNGDEEKALKSLSCPVLILAGGQDKIVPVQDAQKQWLGYNLKICEKGGHALPLTHGDWCSEQIDMLLR